MTWTESGQLIFGGNGIPLRTMAATGGAFREITKLAQGDAQHTYPFLLPGGRGLLFTRWPIRAAAMQQTGQANATDLLADAANGKFLLDRTLVFTRGDALWGVLWKEDAMTMAGDPRSGRAALK